MVKPPPHNELDDNDDVAVDDVVDDVDGKRGKPTHLGKEKKKMGQD